MSVEAYTKEFYKIQIRYGHRESSKEKFARHANGLKFIFRMNWVCWNLASEDAYQNVLKAKEKLGIKQGKKVAKVKKSKQLVSKKKFILKQCQNPTCHNT